MNTSVTSMYDNLTPVNKNYADSSHESVVISDLCKVLNLSGPVIYCPFCVTSVSDLIAFHAHLSSLHYSFLLELTRRSVSLEFCPFCPGKFVGTHLVAKHSLLCHGNVLVDAFFLKTRTGVNCLFCSFTVHLRDIVNHLEELHTLQYDDWFKNSFQLKPGGVAGLVRVPPKLSLRTNECDVHDLSEHLEHLSVATAKIKSILKSPTSREKNVSKLPVRRVLRFDDEKENCKNTASTSSKKKPPTKEVSKRYSGSWYSTLRNNSFQCGKCSVSFSSHAQLFLHVKKEHRKLSLNLLHPFFQCALCGAKFFKSSYLRKHSASHSLSKIR